MIGREIDPISLGLLLAASRTLPAQGMLPRYLERESEHHRLSSSTKSYGSAVADL